MTVDHNSNSIVEEQLHDRISRIEQRVDADALAYVGPIAEGTDGLFKFAIESISNRKPKMLVLLETNGGYIEVAERIVNVLRHHYGLVDFVVPNFAMSAGTVLVMSGDDIFMDYSSVLGPIDPQVRRQGQQFVPALGYLEQYKRLIDKSANGTLTTAEMAYFVANFDPAEMYQYEQARELSHALLCDWLVRYKFKDWKRTGTRKKTVTKAMRTARARQIAKTLSSTERWRSHSRGIPMDVLRHDLKLDIKDFGEDNELSDGIKDYYRLLRDYMMRRGHDFALHSQKDYSGV